MPRSHEIARVRMFVTREALEQANVPLVPQAAMRAFFDYVDANPEKLQDNAVLYMDCHFYLSEWGDEDGEVGA